MVFFLKYAVITVTPHIIILLFFFFTFVLVLILLPIFHFSPLSSSPFLGAFEKLRKATISFMSVRLSAWNNSAPTGRILMKPDV
jgi:hypothetical protein